MTAPGVAVADPLFLQGDAHALPLGDGSAALIVTSPPYWNGRAYASWPTYGAYLASMAEAWAECYRVLCNGGRIAVVICDGYGRPGNGGYKCIGDDTGRALQAAGFTIRAKPIWDKRPAGLGTAWGSWQSASDPSIRDCHEVIIVAHKGPAKRRPGISTIDRATFLAATASMWSIRPAPKSWHPAPFPAEIPRRLIELYSYAGDTVLDPFAGSFTAPIVAALIGRRGVGVEASAEYVARARAAWAAGELQAGLFDPDPAPTGPGNAALHDLGAWIGDPQQLAWIGDPAELAPTGGDPARRRRRRAVGVASV